MTTWIKKAWNETPLPLILIIAIILRLIAVIFAKGWGMFDDHYLIIESAQSWVDGLDETYWMPWSPYNKGPTGHMLLYPGFHFLFFTFLEFLGIRDPQVKMFVVRFIHAAFSLLTIVYVYRIAEKLDGKRSARLIGLLLAALWMMPWLSVRNLIEEVCIPFLAMAFWLMIRKDKPARPFLIFFTAGILFGLATDIRLQSVLFPAGVGIVLLFRKQWKEFLGLTVGTLAAVTLILGTIDLFLWGVPFAELLGYINVCFTERDAYISLPWYNYFLTVGGGLIPPVSLFLFFGFFRNWKKYTLFFLPTLLFFVFHSYFPNKQERFILPFVPFFILLGIIGWNQFIHNSRFWQRNSKLLRGCWVFFWIVNLLLLSVVTVNYSKRARVESMKYLSRYPDIQQILVANDENRSEQYPRFYLGQWAHIYGELAEGETSDSLIRKVARFPRELQPRFILFTGEGLLQERVQKARESFPFLVYETTIKPGLIDDILHRVNPFNKNETVFIYRNLEFYPTQIE